MGDALLGLFAGFFLGCIVIVVCLASGASGWILKSDAAEYATKHGGVSGIVVTGFKCSTGYHIQRIDLKGRVLTNVVCVPNG